MYGSFRAINGFGLLVLITLIFSSCTYQEPSVSATNAFSVAPTQSPLFQIHPTGTTVQPASLSVPTARPASTRVPFEEQIVELPIFDEQLAPNWSLEGSAFVVTDPAYSGYSKSGTMALAATPLRPEAQLQLSVKPDSAVRYRRDRILGISFWLSGGKNYITPEDLGVALQGSNTLPYWDPNDKSVTLEGRVTDDSPLFSETRLYYLDIHNNIPPETWVEVTLWLDDRVFDPDYTYLTGFYIKNDTNFRKTFYIDKVRLLMQKDS